LHKAVLTGMIQALKFSQSVPKGASITLADIVAAGHKGIKSSDARFWIFEYIKDGSQVSKQGWEEICRGDYAGGWKSVNAWLKNYGYEPAEPEEITLQNVDYKIIIEERKIKERKINKK